MRKSEVKQSSGITMKQARENLTGTIGLLRMFPNKTDGMAFRDLFDEMEKPYACHPDVIGSITELLSDENVLRAAAKERLFPIFVNKAVTMVETFVEDKQYNVKNNGTVKEFIRAVLRTDGFEYPELIRAQKNAVGILYDLHDLHGYDEYQSKILDDVVKNNMYDFVSVPYEVRYKALSVLEDISSENPKLQIENVVSYICHDYDAEDKKERRFKRDMFNSMVKPFFGNVENKKLDDDNTALKLLVSKFGDNEFGAWAVNTALEWSFKNEPNTTWERQYIVDRMIAKARKAGKNDPVHNVLKDVAELQPEFVRERIVNYIENGVMGGKLTLTDAYKEKGMAYLLDNKGDVLNRAEKLVLSVFYNSKAHRIFAAYREGVAVLTGKDGKQHVSPNNILVNSYISGHEHTGNNVGPDNKIVNPPIL